MKLLDDLASAIDSLGTFENKEVTEEGGNDFIKTIGWVMLGAFILLLLSLGLIYGVRWLGSFANAFTG